MKCKARPMTDDEIEMLLHFNKVYRHRNIKTLVFFAVIVFCGLFWWLVIRWAL